MKVLEEIFYFNIFIPTIVKLQANFGMTQFYLNEIKKCFLTLVPYSVF